MATSLDDLLSKWNDEFLTDDSPVHDTKELVNQVTRAFPMLAKGSLKASDVVLDENSDWNMLSENSYYVVTSFDGKNAPSGDKLGGTEGYVFNFKDSALPFNVQIVFSSKGLVASRTGVTSWLYVNNLDRDSLADEITATIKAQINGLVKDYLATNLNLSGMPWERFKPSDTTNSTTGVVTTTTK